MVIVPGVQTPANMALSDEERKIFNLKNASTVAYHYDSEAHLKFELRLRTRIVQSARSLLASGAHFATFKTSRCNASFWIRTSDGGFRLREGRPSSAAIQDIFANGKLYAFECATAMIIVLYKAVLDTIGNAKFNKLFANLYLHDWTFDTDLHLITINSTDQTYPGDIIYFKNPDVSPLTPQWQGENAIILGEGLYYGHGIGIKTAEEMIAALNSHRVPNSTKSAYLYNETTYPGFNALYQAAISERGRAISRDLSIQKEGIVAIIGSHTYIRD